MELVDGSCLGHDLLGVYSLLLPVLVMPVLSAVGALELGVHGELSLWLERGGRSLDGIEIGWVGVVPALLEFIEYFY